MNNPAAGKGGEKEVEKHCFMPIRALFSVGLSMTYLTSTDIYMYVQIFECIFECIYIYMCVCVYIYT